MSWSLACNALTFKAIASVTGTMSGPDWEDVIQMTYSSNANMVQMIMLFNDGSMGILMKAELSKYLVDNGFLSSLVVMKQRQLITILIILKNNLF